MENQAKHLCSQIKEVCLNTSKSLAFKPPSELSVYLIKNLLIINVEGIFNIAELIAAESRQNREKIILARHAVAAVWVNKVAEQLINILNLKPLTHYLDYRPEFNSAMFVLYYDRALLHDAGDNAI